MFCTRHLIVAVMCAAVCQVATAEPLRWVASWEQGKPADGLSLVEVGDGLTEEIDADGRPCIITRGYYIYFNIADEFAHEIGTDMTIVVDYRDDDTSDVFVEYDAMTSNGRASYRHSNRLDQTGSGQWRQMIFRLPGAWMANGENNGSDLRIVLFGSRSPVYRVTLSVDGLEKQTYPSDDAKQRALRQLKLTREKEATSKVIAQWSSRERNGRLQPADETEQAWAGQQAILQIAETAKERLMRSATSQESLEDEASLRKHIEQLRDDRRLVTDCAELLDARVRMLEFLQGHGRNIHEWYYFARPAIDNSSVVLPWSLPASTQVNAAVNLRVCRGEYEPYLLGLMSTVLVKGVKIEPTDLHGLHGGMIPADHVDVRIVKRWYQAGRRNETQTGRELVPEMLLYDDSLVQTDLIHQKNVLHFQGQPKDATSLRPFDLQPLHTKLLWLTVRGPQDAADGDYYGSVIIQSENCADLTVPVRVEILPFELEPNPKISSMYYHKHVGNLVGAERDRYRRRLINMREHGLTNPAFQGGREELALRQQVGVNKGPLLMFGGWNISKYLGREDYGDDEVESLRSVVDKYDALARDFGYDGAYFYAIDEASGDRLLAEVPAFRLLDRVGGRAWAAVLSDYEQLAAVELQMPNYSGIPSRSLVDKVHAAGHKIMRYAVPQGGTEDPWQYRYYYGLVLWEMNLDGGCTFAYQTAMGNPWDDFDGGGTYRDFMMTYPGADGPIDTVQWEGYREGCDDLRYMATLEKALAEAKERVPTGEIVREVDKWLAGRREAPYVEMRQWCRQHDVQPFHGDNLNAVREKMIAYILRLRAAGSN